jgi:hypothetical protein
MINQEQLEAFKVVYPEAKAFSEGGFDFVHIPKLVIPGDDQSEEVEALLCPQMRDGYATRLFLSKQIPGKGNNWNAFHILGRTWYSWSWQNVQANQELTQILMGHLAAFR